MTASRDNPRRRYIRHTAGVPIEVRMVPESPHARLEGRNVSFGGLAFTSNGYIEPGSTVDIRIASVEPAFEAHARVAWCQREDSRFQVGVQFLDSTDAFRSRMVEQVCAIERYRNEVFQNEGRSLSPEEAAAEWIARYAGRFPDSEADGA